MVSKILVTGGCGYIGSHTTLVLLEAGYEVVILDDLSNSKVEPLVRVEKLTGKCPELVVGDIRDRGTLTDIFRTHNIDAVMHFAGLKSVKESTEKPLDYFDVNVIGTLRLLESMNEANVYKFVFSSSATVYGSPETMPIRELFPLAPMSPYGVTKSHIEDTLRCLISSDKSWRAAILRYFNPAGAHYSGYIGEDPLGLPSNLLPFITKVAVGRLDKLSIFGNDYDTPDGTGIRDYIHVMDLANGHLKALKALDNHRIITCNLGTGVGHSVLEVINIFQQVTGIAIPYEIRPKRPGDVAESYTDPGSAQKLLNWRASLTLRDICKDHWRWQNLNPDGY